MIRNKRNSKAAHTVYFGVEVCITNVPFAFIQCILPICMTDVEKKEKD